MDNRKKSKLVGTMRIYTRKAADAAELFFAFENDFQKVGEKNEYTIKFEPRLDLERKESESCISTQFTAEEAVCFEAFLESFFLCKMSVITKDWSVLFDYVGEDHDSKILYHQVLGYTHQSGDRLDEWNLKEYEYFQAGYNMYTLKKYMGYSNEKIAEIFEKDDHAKCLKDAAESYRALEHPEMTLSQAIDVVMCEFPFLKEWA